MKNKNRCHMPPFLFAEFTTCELKELIELPLAMGVVGINNKVLEVP